MSIKILFFGQLAETTGVTELELPAIESTDALRSHLLQLFPQLANSTFAIALNQTVVQSNAAIPPHSEIALLPPFSGG